MAQITISAAAAQLLPLLLMLFSVGASAAEDDPRPMIGMPNCVTSCGGVDVPYPFGLGPDPSCYLPGFNLTCDTAAGDAQARLLLDVEGTLQVLSISNSILRAQRNGDVKIDLDADGYGSSTFSTGLRQDGPYMLYRNELFLTGCNVQATVRRGNVAVASCTSLCEHYDHPADSLVGGVVLYCKGSTGCCRADIVTNPDIHDEEAQVYSSSNTSGYDVQLRWLGRGNRSADLKRFPPRVFISERGWFSNVSVYNDMLRTAKLPSKDIMAVPIYLNWVVVGNHSLCKGNHSQCVEPTGGGRYCLCKTGYHGNPYLTDGCKDVNECELAEANGCYGECTNAEGTFTCQCPLGTIGNPAIPGGCVYPTVSLGHHHLSISIILGVASGAGLILLVLFAYVIFDKVKHQRTQKLKRKFFEQNRGQLLQQLVSQRADIAEKMIITLEELEKATNNFDKARELGGGGHGTVYKGILSDLHVVAIKKPKMVVQKEIDEFINEVAILSQINHRNVVKLYGCCLETEVPMLVYEFISNGTLYDHLHIEGPRSLSWDDRLRIAIETAKSLAYLHSMALIPIIHRDIKSSNILLDDTLIAKVADFGASRYIPLDKSDGLVAHFVTLFAEGNLSQILDPQVLNESGNTIEEIATIAVACVKLRGEERPTMRQVELRLEGVQSPDEHVMAVVGEFEANGIDRSSLLTRDERSTEGLTRQYSMEEECILSSRYPR
ncbi:wall-associated receptor kinase 5-like [Triticum aestivum]|uniref:wall-associated receptor kinase 5-like n=1 Tax=Triticum aestivum TaxID=4565 RepID=UPI001D023009|nr:wall-associated receptor kinase 5-like [Triticum aestivum]